MKTDQVGPTVTIRATVKKFTGDSTDDRDLIETVVSEETVPIASLPPDMQAHLLAQKEMVK